MGSRPMLKSCCEVAPTATSVVTRSLWSKLGNLRGGAIVSTNFLCQRTTLLILLPTPFCYSFDLLSKGFGNLTESLNKFPTLWGIVKQRPHITRTFGTRPFGYCFHYFGWIMHSPPPPGGSLKSQIHPHWCLDLTLVYNKNGMTKISHCTSCVAKATR